MDLPDFSAFDEDEPHSFYLGAPEDTDFDEQSDATLVAEGVRLVVHSQILSQNSRVLRAMFAEKQLASSPILDCMFEGYSLRSVCALLRFFYWPEEASTRNFSQLEPSTTLPEVARLAHMLDAPALLGKLERFLAATLTSSSLEAAVAWTQLAERCHLHKLQLQCIHELARKLAAKGLSRESLLAVLAACVAAARGQQEWVPSEEELKAAGAV
ncbi:hypothetical protein ABPG77_001760 [Micractinium sp. CCAP 211/92]